MEDFPITTLPAAAGWSENFCLAGYDPQTGIDLFIHIGRWRKDLSLWRELVAIALPDGSILAHRSIGNSRAAADGPGGPLLKKSIVEDQSRSCWTFDGALRRTSGAELRRALLSDGPLERVSFELDFNGIAPMWDISHVGHTTEFMGTGHLEQLGRVRGPIQVGDVRYDFDGILNRDHSRGVRSFGQNLRHIWMHGWFANGVGFQLYEAEIEAGRPAFSNATVIDGGKHYDAQFHLGFRLPLEHGLDDADSPVSFTLTYARGSLDIVTTRFPTTIFGCGSSPNDLYLGMNGVEQNANAGFIEQSAEYLLDGAAIGHGHMERLIPGRWVSEP